MKKWCVILCVMIGAVLPGSKVSAQADELAQLALNIEKLSQFKSILSDMKKGYELLTGGYNTVKNIAEGNFKLHKVFLDGLMEVSPAVRNYKRIGDIINYQVRIIKEYKSAIDRFRASGLFTLKELDYFSKVYSGLTKSALSNLDDLLAVTTSGTMRMSDEERLSAIDDIYTDMADKLNFLRVFNQQAEVLRIQRSKEAGTVNKLQQLYK